MKRLIFSLKLKFRIGLYFVMVPPGLRIKISLNELLLVETNEEN